jgi:hypothetical protein
MRFDASPHDPLSKLKMAKTHKSSVWRGGRKKEGSAPLLNAPFL